MLISEWKDGAVEITYDHPRLGLPVAAGTILFRGARDGARYSGTAYTFKAGCSPAPYAVTGMKDQKEMIIMTGAAPRRDLHSCDVIGESAQIAPAKLVFDTKFYGDEWAEVPALCPDAGSSARTEIRRSDVMEPATQR
jgi:hypothetical protein